MKLVLAKFAVGFVSGGYVGTVVSIYSLFASQYAVAKNVAAMRLGTSIMVTVSLPRLPKHRRKNSSGSTGKSRACALRHAMVRVLNIVI